ncbi:Cyclic pyranopterin monophosphate synthase [Vibrio ruber DSM 16370]|uniref:GTP 3',8-cyclase n=1 Tax=Vibrio ruber (strain DSM 16370 / JCM 11486 / BCRC 17186 / CECT 7878 / LMG 23124 / VR1) TaxID=1123498 RepID=A0A1R4LKI3_VIBR1|nr:GTP 3',8-cyclase MoaA [Vibrio ruber]SJN57111.1 Cyclic pyranopterin monophosphate synthase [Vibrio ruber DSM 16370]
MAQFEDNFQRKFYYLRLSLTDVCNFKCTYCLPDGYQTETQRPQFLSQPEIQRVVTAFASCGTSKVRLTGGEPTLRRDFSDIVHLVSSTPGIDRVAMTTNGFRLAKSAAEWHQAGLTNINVSVDSLDPRMFHQITGENKYRQVMDGIEQALAVGFSQIKVNVVLLKGLNDRQLPAFLDWIRDLPIQLRFIELMQTGTMDDFFYRHHVSGQAVYQQLLGQGWIPKVRACHDGPAKVLAHPDYQGELGFIMPYEKNFCASCNRLRVSAKGKLHLCLFGESGVGLRDLLQQDEQQTALIERIQQALGEKAVSHFLHDGHSGMTPHLASIGG